MLPERSLANLEAALLVGMGVVVGWTLAKAVRCPPWQTDPEAWRMIARRKERRVRAAIRRVVMSRRQQPKPFKVTQAMYDDAVKGIVG